MDFQAQLMQPAVGAGVLLYPTDGLIQELLFSGDMTDSSGNGNNATNVGSATLTTDRFSVTDEAYQFTAGVTSVDTNLKQTASPISLVFILYIDALGDKYLVNSGGDSSLTKGMFLYLRSDGGLELWISDGASVPLIIDFPLTDLLVDTYYICLLSWDGTTDTDGISLTIDDTTYNATAIKTWTGDSTDDLAFMGNVDRANGPSGKADLFLRYNRVIDPSEINLEIP